MHQFHIVDNKKMHKETAIAGVWKMYRVLVVDAIETIATSSLRSNADNFGIIAI